VLLTLAQIFPSGEMANLDPDIPAFKGMRAASRPLTRFQATSLLNEASAISYLASGVNATAAKSDGASYRSNNSPVPVDQRVQD
jgi:hypothetical protein